MTLLPKLFPVPRKLEQKEGFLSLPKIWRYWISDSNFEPAIQAFARLTRSPISPDTFSLATLKIEKAENFEPEAFRLLVKPDGINVFAGSTTGAFRALQCLKQLIPTGPKEGISHIEIEDSPVLRRRGFMLDVSRCKVPTMESLYSLIDLLCELRFNELQLYVEHTFAFAEHNEVWKDASPLTGQEIRELDQFCRERFIELVPNLNSFGHFERWLRHKNYKHLAECPDGFRRENPFMVRDHGTTLKPNQESLAFIDKLYEEYLPHFSSSNFNVGLDEPWELGQGWSKPEVERIGKDKVYLKHLEGIRKLVEKHGKQMQFWADVLLEKPANASLLPPTASPVIWGYEADHPFSEQAKAISSCNLPFCLAPGTATWRSFSGRWPVAQANLLSATENAIRFDASGILLTTWGDCGNHQPWPIFYPPLFYGAHLFWNGNEARQSILTSQIDKTLWPETPGLGEVILRLASLDNIIGSAIPNQSLPWFTLFNSQPEKLAECLKTEFQSIRIDSGQDLLNEVETELTKVSPSSSLNLPGQEIKLGIQMSRLGLELADSLLNNRSPDFGDRRTLLETFEQIWLQRARPGGLRESLDLLAKAIDF